MTPESASPGPDRLEAEYLALCDELHDDLLGVDGAECVLRMERWQLRCIGSHPHLMASIRNHIEGMRLTLTKNPGMNVNIQGNNNNYQHGANVANVGNMVPQPPPGSASRRSPFIFNLALGVITGLLVAWGMLSDRWAFGQTRLLVTVFVAVTAAVTGITGWFQFRKAAWEKFAYIGLASALIVRSAIPSIDGWLKGSAEASPARAAGVLDGYFSLSDNTTLAIVQLIAGVVILGFAFLARSSPK